MGEGLRPCELQQAWGLLTGERCGKYIFRGLQGWAGAYLGPRGEGLERVPGSSGLVGAVGEDWRCFVV